MGRNGSAFGELIAETLNMSVIRLQILLLSLSLAMDERPELHDELYCEFDDGEQLIGNILISQEFRGQGGRCLSIYACVLQRR